MVTRQQRASAVMTPPPLYPPLWAPQPKQAEFLSCPDYEVLYGGAAGGGKSDAILIDALGLQQNGPGNLNYRAVIFRKNAVDLKDLIDRARALYEELFPGIKYNKTDRVFVFPSGAKVELTYCENEDDRFKYRGRAFTYEGFEELTTWPTAVVYHYLRSRNRTTDPTLTCYVRSTTNPDGPGQKWVMEEFGIEEAGAGTLLEREIDFEILLPDGSVGSERRTIRRRFIPAKLSDNKYLVGTGYRERLADLPPDDREALLLGRWTGNRVRGAYYVTEMQKLRAEGRLCQIAHQPGIPVNTFWDLGHNDTTAIWWHQYAVTQNRFLKCYETSGEGLEYFAALLQRMQTERGWVYDTHYLPHDADTQRLGIDTRSILAQLKALLPGHRFKVVPRIDHIFNGIQMTRAAFPTVWINKDECADGVAALDSYRKKWNPMLEVFGDTPVHDQFSNYADAFRQFAQGFDASRAVRQEQVAQGIERPRKRRKSNNWKTA